MFTKVAKCDQCRKQHCEWHSYRGHENSKVKEQLAQHLSAQIFSDYIVKVLQHVLGQQDKHYDKKSHDERTYEGSKNELINFFHLLSPVFMGKVTKEF